MSTRSLTAKNVFFGTHTLKERRVWDVDKKPKPGWRVRVQENMRSSRIFFFDLDVEEGNDKKYSTQSDALVALQSFCRHYSFSYSYGCV